MYTLSYTVSITSSQYRSNAVSFTKTAGIGLGGTNTILLVDTSNLLIGMVVRDVTNPTNILANTIITSITTNTSITLSRNIQSTLTGDQIRFYYAPPPEYVQVWVGVQSPQVPLNSDVAASRQYGTLYPTWAPTREFFLDDVMTFHGSWTGPMNAGQTAIMGAFVDAEGDEVYIPVTNNRFQFPNYFAIERIA